MRSKYSTQELLEMRTTALSGEMLKRISIEPGVREHVIARTTKLDHARPSSRGRMSSTAAPASANGYELPPNDDFYFQGKQSARAPRFARDSPSASLRGRKAKAFLEQHGSPPGHRVTAGGRIVPDGVWPIKSPTNYPSVPTIHPHALQDGAVDHLNGLLVNVGNQNICQIVNGGFVHVGKENGQLLLVMPPTNDTLSMDGVPLHKSGHSMQHVPANHFGNGAASNNSFPPPPYGGGPAYNSYLAGGNVYTGNSNMQPHDGFAYSTNPNGYHGDGSLANNQPHYSGAPPHFAVPGNQYFGNVPQYFGNNTGQYHGANFQSPGVTSQYPSGNQYFPSSNTQYPGGIHAPFHGHQYSDNFQNHGNTQHATNAFHGPPNGRNSVSGARQVSGSNATSRQVSGGGKGPASIRARDPLGGMRPNCDAIRLLEKVLKGHEQALADLNRNEVINRSRMSDMQHNEVVRKRVELTERMNIARKSLQETRNMVFSDNNTQPLPALPRSGPQTSRNPSQARNSSQEQSVIRAPSVVNDQRFFNRSNSSNYSQTHPGMHTGHQSPHHVRRAGSLEPTAKEFVPVGAQVHNAPKPGQEQLRLGKPFDSPESKILVERLGNAGLGISTSSHGTNRSQNRLTAKHENSLAQSQGINLDGISTNGRRSHAIEIKRPEHMKHGASNKVQGETHNSAVSTTQKERSEDGSAFEPSPRLIAEMMTIITTPEEAFAALKGGNGTSPQHVVQEHQVNASSNTSFNTASSATTGDFFPSDPQAHSVHNWSYSKSKDNTVNLSNWLPKEGEEVVSPSNVTPVKGTNKFRFNDSDSPLEENRPPYEKRDAPPITGQGMLSSPQATSKSEHLAQKNQPAGDKEQASSVISTSFVTNKSNESVNLPSTPTKRTPSKTDQYWSGFRTGLHQFVLPDVTDEDYRLGYRDGLLNSGNHDPRMTPTKTIDSSPIRIRKANLPFRSGGATSSFITRSDPTLKTRAPSNASSPLRRSFGSDEATEDEITIHYQGESLLPRTDEKTHLSASQNSSPFQPMPYVPIPEPISPLVNRQGAFEERLIASVKKMPPASGSRIFSGGSYAQQRYVSKGQPSVAPSPSHAHGRFPQLDGSNDDENRLVPLEDGSTAMGPSAPLAQNDKGKQKAPSSPIKRASSAMRQLTSIGGPKKDKDAAVESVASSKDKLEDDADPALMSAADKIKWKGRWKRRFENLKVTEDKEIEDNRKRNAGK